MNREVRLEWLVVVSLAGFALVNAICWATVIPLGDAPDEPGHFEVVAFEAIFRDIPVFGIDDYGTTVRIARDGYRSPLNTYSAQPGLSYLVSVVAIDLFSDLAGDPARAARYPGALWAALMPLVAYLGVGAMFARQRGVALLAAVVATFWPQLAFLFSYINNDGLTTLACGGLVASWFIGRTGGWASRHVLVTGLAVGLVLVNKPNGFPLVALTAVILAVSLHGGLAERSRKIGLATVASLVGCGWWYLIAYRRYGWDLLASGRAESLREALGVEWASGRFYGKSLIETALEPFPRFGETWIMGTLRTAVGAFGEITIGLPGSSYVVIGLLTGAAIAGLGWMILRSTGDDRLGWMHWVALLTIPAYVALSLYRSWAYDFQAQGRYLFPAMLPFVGFLALGLLGPIRGRVRAGVGFAVTLVFAGVLVDAFVVRLLGAYRMTFGDLWEGHPILAGGWVGCLALSMGCATLYWLRMLKADESRCAAGSPEGRSPE